MIDPELLKAVLRQWTSGTTLVTAQYAGVPHGMTVTSFTSVSLDPPLILVCLKQKTRTHGMVATSGAFAVSVLADDQDELSVRFASRDAEVGERFEGLGYRTGVSGAPILEDCLAYFDCLVVSASDHGTHTVFVGKVLDAKVAREARPLIYYNRAFHRLPE